MKTKHVLPIVLFTVLAAFFMGCGSKADEGAVSDVTGNIEVSADEGDLETEGKTVDGESQTLTASIDEIKDFMFIVTAEDGNSYVFPFEEKPADLVSLNEGDRVTITYTGELSVVDNFMGEIISIEKTE